MMTTYLNNETEHLIYRIWRCRASGASMEETHESLVDRGDVSEDKFFLAWKASDFLIQDEAEF